MAACSVRAIIAAAFKASRGSREGVAGEGESLKVFFRSVSESSLDSGLVASGFLAYFLGGMEAAGLAGIFFVDFRMGSLG